MSLFQFIHFRRFFILRTILPFLRPMITDHSDIQISLYFYAFGVKISLHCSNRNYFSIRHEPVPLASVSKTDRSGRSHERKILEPSPHQFPAPRARTGRLGHRRIPAKYRVSPHRPLVLRPAFWAQEEDPVRLLKRIHFVPTIIGLTSQESWLQVRQPHFG